MTFRSMLKSRGLVCGVLAAFMLLVMPVREFAKAQLPDPQGGSLVGFIYGKDMKTPVAGAVVRIRNLGGQKELTSPRTDANGMYKISGIPEGRYLFGVSSAQGDFDFDYVLRLKADDVGKLSVALAPGGQAAGESAPKKKGIFNTLAGRALLVTVAGVAIYLAFVTEKEASPIR